MPGRPMAAKVRRQSKKPAIIPPPVPPTITPIGTPSARTDMARATTELSVNERSLEDAERQKDALTQEITALDLQIFSTPKEVIDIKNVKNQILDCESTIDSLQKLNVDSVVHHLIKLCVDSIN